MLRIPFSIFKDLLHFSNIRVIIYTSIYFFFLLVIYVYLLVKKRFFSHVLLNFNIPG